MNYKLENIRLRKVAEGKRNAGSLFIQATCVNPDDDWDEPVEMTSFNERMVAKFSELLNVAMEDGLDQFGRTKYKASTLKDATKPVPESMLSFTSGNLEEVQTPGGVEYVQVDDTGKPIKNPKTGQFYRRTSIFVLTKKTRDNETGETRYAKGWSPTEQASSIFNNLYAPAAQFDEQLINSPIVLPQDPAAPAPTPAAAPAV